MLKQLKLTNYRQHIDRTVDFTPGINAIRGHVEAGKSTTMEAWMYLFFGAKALSEPLEDVVTYDTPLSKLKVEGVFTHLGVDYTCYRGKSGAELSFGREKVTGQTEVTRFFEQLFNCSAAMAARLMVAEQVKLRGALEEGPKAAGDMIEYLADFDLLDRVISLIQTELSSGATTGVESRIALLTAQAVEVVAVDLQPLEKAVAGAQDVLAKDRGILADKLADLENLDVVQASQILAEEKSVSARIGVRSGKITELQAWTTAELPVAPESTAIDAVRAKIEAQKNLAAAARLHAELKVATVDVLWDEPRAALDAAVVEAQVTVAEAKQQSAKADDALVVSQKARITSEGEFRLALQKLEGRLIKETTCALCQKDLADVPEVVTINNDLTAQVETLRAARALEKTKEDSTQAKNTAAAAQAQKALDAAVDEMYQLQTVATADDRMNLVLARASDYITVDAGVVPARWTWTGPTAEAQDFASDLAALVTQDRAATAAAATRAAQLAQLEDLKAEQTTDTERLTALPVADAQETIDLAEEIKPKIAFLRTEVEKAADAVHLAEGALATAKVSNEQGANSFKAAKAQLAAAQQELDDMLANNILINKVRKARPVITNKLWNLTLGATSKYFTDVRGIPSVVTRDTAFKCNGKPVAGLSGSAKDSLGLAMRVSLVKTFLPTMPFMMLDEPAAACNAERETNMLGLLSTIGFDQVILITHSDLADAYADNVIRL